MTTNKELAAVRRAARRAALAREELEQAICAAYAAGLSLRAIGEVAGVSYETVRRITA